MPKAKKGFEDLVDQLEAAIYLKVRKDWEFTSDGQRFTLSLKPTEGE